MKLFVSTYLILVCFSPVAVAQCSVQLDLTEQKAYLLYDDRAIIASQISSGRPGHLTPAGAFHNTDKDLNHVSGIYGRIVDRRGPTVVAECDVDMPTPVNTKFVNAPKDGSQSSSIPTIIKR